MTPCAEGAIVLENGKARVISEALCDGAGFCVSICPTGALSTEARDTLPFDAQQAEDLMHQRGQTYIAQHCFRCRASEEFAPLLPLRHEGKSLWVCTRCLPALIHG